MPEGVPDYQSTTIDLVSALPVLGCRCNLSYCIRSYTATIISGVLEESLISVSSNWSTYSENSGVLGTVNVGCLEPAVRSRLLLDGYIGPNTEWMSWNGSYLQGTEAQAKISSSDNLAILVRCSYQALLLNVYFLHDASTTYADDIYGVLSGVGTFQGQDMAFSGPSSTSLLELWNDQGITIDSISAAMSNFTDTVTSLFRTYPGPIPKNISSYNSGFNPGPGPAIPVQGTVSNWNQPAVGGGFVSSSCVHIRWPWLSLPAALVVAAAVFLVALTAQTADVGSGEVWKSTPNALLWHGLDGVAEYDSKNLRTATSMNQRARELIVQLRPTRRGWKLVEEDVL